MCYALFQVQGNRKEYRLMEALFPHKHFSQLTAIFYDWFVCWSSTHSFCDITQSDPQPDYVDKYGITVCSVITIRANLFSVENLQHWKLNPKTFQSWVSFIAGLIDLFAKHNAWNCSIWNLVKKRRREEQTDGSSMAKPPVVWASFGSVSIILKDGGMKSLYLVKTQQTTHDWASESAP